MKLRTITVMIAVFIMMFCASAAVEAKGSANGTGDKFKFSGNIYVQENETVSGNVVAINGNIYINGVVMGDVVSVSGDIIVNGKVMGDVTAVSGKITVGENAKVMGNTVEVFGGSNRKPRVNAAPLVNASNILFSFLRTIVLFLFASLVYVILPKHTGRMADTIDRNLGKRLGIGFLGLILSPMAMVIVTLILAITIIGILIIPFAWVAYIVAALIALVPAYIFIGKKLVGLTGASEITNYGALAAGVFSLWLIKAVIGLGGAFTSWINVLISLFIFVLGTGTLIDYIFANRRRKAAYAGSFPQGEGYGPKNQDMPVGSGEQTGKEYADKGDLQQVQDHDK